MTIQMTIGLPLEKVYEYLLRYFQFNKSVDVKQKEPNYIKLHAGSYWNREYASSNVEIEIRPEENETQLTLNFSFRGYYLTALIFGVLALAIIWIVPTIFLSWAQPMIADQPYPIIGSIVLSIVILVWWSIAVPIGISKTKRKFLEDIHEAFNMPNKTDYGV